MTLAKLPKLSIVITVSFQTVLVLGETFLVAEPNKDSGLKITDKRMNNFRVPMETPFDPNFWPARGRRNRRDPEKSTTQNDDCTEDSFRKNGIQCQDPPKIQEEKSTNGKLPPLNFELTPSLDLGDELLPRDDKMENCFENGGAFKITERSKVKIPDILESMALKRIDEMRRKKQKHFLLPRLIFYGNGVYWEPENLFGEKKKKEDVFWVARGKKNINLNYALK